MRHSPLTYARYTIICAVLAVAAPANASPSPAKINKDQINQLSLPILEKNILLSGQIYQGATHDVILLALGAPRFVTGHLEEGQLIEVWGYHFEKDGRPTLLELRDGALKTAYRSSYADIDAKYGRIAMRFQQ